MMHEAYWKRYASKYLSENLIQVVEPLFHSRTSCCCSALYSSTLYSYCEITQEEYILFTVYQ